MDYINFNFNDEDVQELIDRYEIQDNDRALVPTAAELILVVDNSASYEGDYGELFVKNGVLYETGCSHCSCYGCSAQWVPKDTSLAVIKLRPRGVEGVAFDEVVARARAAGYTGE